jgi:hypothetical protein
MANMIEVLKLAQEWQSKDWSSESPMSADYAISEANDVIDALIKAITSLRQAIAELESQGKTMKVEGPLHVVCQCDKCKTESQEPVAWRYGVPKLKNGKFEWRYSINKTREDAIPLYKKEQL